MNHTTSFARRLTGLALGLAILTCLASTAGAGMTCETLDECPCVFDMVESTLGRGWVGISLQQTEQGYFVSELVPEGPAERAGLKLGDRLLAMNGVPMFRKHEEKLAEVYRRMVPDSELTYTVERKGTKQDVTIILGHLPEKILAVVLGQQLLESYAETTGKPLHPPKAPPPPPPEPPNPRRDETPPGG